MVAAPSSSCRQTSDVDSGSHAQRTAGYGKTLSALPDSHELDGTLKLTMIHPILVLWLQYPTKALEPFPAISAYFRVASCLKIPYREPLGSEVCVDFLS